MILCAGLGTRLRPLTDWRAKPMVPVGDAPAVAHVATRVRASLPAAALVVNVHHRPADVHAWASRAGARVSEEAELLGTAGGLAHAAPLLGGGDVLVWNGDILSSLVPADLVRAHLAALARGAQATLAVRARPAGEGNVGLDEAGRVVRLRRERFGDEASGGEFLGIHVVGAALRAALPERGCLVGDVYLPALRRGESLAGFVSTASFVDVGTLGEYLAANRSWLAERGLASWVGSDAEVRADVTGSVVGAGARVDAPALRSVVWPGAHVREPIADAVIAPEGIART